MNNKLAWKILAVTISSLILAAMGLPPSFRIAASPLAAEEPPDNSEYIYCCQDNQFSWGRYRYSRRYDLGNIETLDGEVVSVDTYISRRGVVRGVHLLVNTGKETVEVHLAPSWYLEEQNFAIAPEDKITITGSRISLDGEQAIIASQLKKGSETFILRDNNGVPRWRGRGWRP